MPSLLNPFSVEVPEQIMAKREPKSIQQQKLALAAFGVLLLLIGGYLTWLVISPSSTQLAEGETYQLIENPRRIRGDQIEVMEFFSYGCVHCYNLDDELAEWVADQGDRVKFVRVPVIVSDTWRLLGQHYYTMEAMDVTEQLHTPTFRVIHDGARLPRSEDDLAQLYEQQGVDAEEFRQVFNSAEVANQLDRADQIARRLQVASVPTIIVQGKYLIRTTRSVGPTLMLETMTQLVDQEMAEKQSTAN